MDELILAHAAPDENGFHLFTQIAASEGIIGPGGVTTSGDVHLSVDESTWQALGKPDTMHAYAAAGHDEEPGDPYEPTQIYRAIQTALATGEPLQLLADDSDTVRGVVLPGVLECGWCGLKPRPPGPKCPECSGEFYRAVTP